MVQDPDAEADHRMAHAKFGNLPGQEVQRQRLAAGNAYGAAAQASEILDLRLHPLDPAVLFAQIVDENLASRRKPYAARPALEQLRAEFLLEVHDSPVHGGCGDIELFGGFADRASARDFVDVSQNAQVLHRKPKPDAWCFCGITLATNQRQM